MADIPIYPCENVGCVAYVWWCEPVPYQQFYWYQHPLMFPEPPPGLLSHNVLCPDDSPMTKRTGNTKLLERHATPCAEQSTSEPAAEPDVVVVCV